MKKRLLFFLLMTSLVLMNACQREYSFENGSGPSEGTLQDDGAGDCLPKTVSGAYVIGTALDGNTNYMEVQVNVTTIGTYTIYTDTVNGIYFRATGVFTTTGLNTVRLKGNGTPAAAGIHNFIVSYGTSGCSVAVTTSGTLAVFTLDGSPGSCTSAAPAGTYMQNTALTSANTVNINVNVTAVGAYSIITSTANGMTFSSSGTFTSPGPQSIVLTGTGTPTTAGVTDIPVTAGSSSCSFQVTVQAAPSAATFTVNCGAAVVNGTYTANTALTASNTISVSVDVTATGTYSITGTANNMTFSASGTFTATGTQAVILAGTGTPTASGATTVSLTGGAAPCDVTVNVNAAAGAATYTINCAGATVNGTYTANTALTAANTISVSVNVTNPGSYTINGTLNGMSFSASGTFAAAGTQTVTLNGSGTPTVAGANAVPLTGGTAGCNVTVNVNPAAGGAATFTVDCTSATANWEFTQGLAVGPLNTININVNVTATGTYAITTTATNGITFSASGTFTTTGNQTVTLTGTGTPVAAGTFNIPVPSGTAPCNFQITVDPSFGTWTFKEGATTYSGVFYGSGLDNTTAPPYLVLFGLGETQAGHAFELDIADLAGGIQNNETYNCGATTAVNAGIFHFEGPPPASTLLYQADPTVQPNSLIITVTSHNTTTKTVTGTFAGNAQDGAGNVKSITNGAFTITYP